MGACLAKKRKGRIDDDDDDPPMYLSIEGSHEHEEAITLRVTSECTGGELAARASTAFGRRGRLRLRFVTYDNDHDNDNVLPYKELRNSTYDPYRRVFIRRSSSGSSDEALPDTGAYYLAYGYRLQFERRH